MSIAALPVCLVYFTVIYVSITLINVLFDKKFERDFDFITSMKCSMRLSLKVILSTALLIGASFLVSVIVYFSIDYLIK